MKQIKLFGLAMLLIAMLGCNSSGNKNRKKDDLSAWKLHNTVEYSIQYPSNWRLDTSGYKGTEFSIFSKQTSLMDKFIENVNLVIRNSTAQEQNLSAFVKLTEEKISKEAFEGKIIQSKRQISNGKEFYKVIYSIKQGYYIIKFEQYYWLANDKVYVLSLAGRANEFKNYQEIGEKILNTFKLK